jgi:hypothetical protein
MARIAALWFVAAWVAFAAPCRADDPTTPNDPAPEAPASEPAAETPAADAAAPIPRINHHQPRRRLTVAQSIEESVHGLARGLDLDADQQDKVREILVDQHRQMLRLHNAGTTASDDVTGAMLSIYDRTRARIRGILTEEQLKKYPAAVPRDQTAAGQADLQTWMKMQENKRKQDGGTSQ